MLLAHCPLILFLVGPCQEQIQWPDLASCEASWSCAMPTGRVGRTFRGENGREKWENYGKPMENGDL